MASARTFEVETNAPPAAALGGNLSLKTKVAVVGSFVATVCCFVGVGVSPLIGGAGESQAMMRSQYDLGCIASHLGAGREGPGRVADCRVTADGLAQGLDRLSGKLAFAGPVQLPLPSLGLQAPRTSSPAIRGGAAGGVAVRTVPVKAGPGNTMMALSADEAGGARRFFIGGNWKANGTPEKVKALVEALNAGEVAVDTKKDVEVVCAPPFVYLSQVKETLRDDYAVAAQNVWDKAPGAWTGEIPAEMLTSMGVGWVVLGHSERRENCGETDQVVAEKTKFAVGAGLSTITCIGEKLDAREGGTTFDVLDTQMKPLAATLEEKDWEKVVLAYEPVWAIGTGKVATPEQAEETHAYLRKWLTDNVSKEVSDSVRILYGGSVNDKNSEELGTKPNIDGFLVGGASLDGEAFTTIVNSKKAEAKTE